MKKVFWVLLILTNLGATNITHGQSNACPNLHDNNYNDPFSDQLTLISGILRPRSIDMGILYLAEPDGQEYGKEILQDSSAFVISSDPHDGSILQQIIKQNALIELAQQTENDSTIVNAMRVLLDNGADINIRSEDGLSAFMLSVIQRRHDAVWTLARYGANVNEKDPAGWTALMHAADAGDADMVEILLENGAYLDTRCDQTMFGHEFACLQFDYENSIVQLVDSTRNMFGMTALMIAAMNGYTNIVEILIKNGADINLKNNGKNARDFAVQANNVNVIKIIDATPTLKLFEAAIKNKDDLILQYIKQGFDINACDNNGFTALMFAVNHGYENIIRVLLQNGANINAYNHEGKTALIMAAQNGNQKIIKLLIHNGANIEARDNYGFTALMHATAFGIHKVIDLLIAHSADVNTSDSAKRTPIMQAAMIGSLESVITLIKHGADVNAQDQDGMTALMFAARFNYREIGEELIKHGANINAQEFRFKTTALMEASLLHHNDFIKLLTTHGADETLKDVFDQTARDIARE